MTYRTFLSYEPLFIRFFCLKVVFHCFFEVSDVLEFETLFIETKTESEISNTLEVYSKSIDVSAHLERDIINEFIAKGNCKIFYILNIAKYGRIESL